MRTFRLAVSSVVFVIMGCQPSPSLEEQCVKATEADANSVRIFSGPDCDEICRNQQTAVKRATEKWIAKVCK
jgi:hypothetical protein